MRVMFGPSGQQRCCDELLRKCAILAEEYNTGFHAHLLETQIQAETGLKMYGKPNPAGTNPDRWTQSDEAGRVESLRYA